ncbi:MAG: hypothetical protein FWG36_01975 [Oscillospiraceae bacterium]|nr:hypothetical protein [Oscillospiraceae bacterium]
MLKTLNNPVVLSIHMLILRVRVFVLIVKLSNGNVKRARDWYGANRKVLKMSRNVRDRYIAKGRSEYLNDHRRMLRQLRERGGGL